MLSERMSEKIVIDTNVFISALFWKGSSHEILKLAENNILKIIVTKQIIDELLLILNRKEFKEKIELKNLKISEIIMETINSAYLIESKTTINACEDPDDNKFLEAAIDGKCKFIINQDKHLLKIREYKGIKILAPEEFLSTTDHT